MKYLIIGGGGTGGSLGVCMAEAGKDVTVLVNNFRTNIRILYIIF